MLIFHANFSLVACYYSNALNIVYLFDTSMKILISAYSCEPNISSSQSSASWNIACEIANYHEVWVLTQPSKSQNKLEAEVPRHLISNLHFVCFNPPFWEGKAWWHSQVIQFHYYLWQIQAYFITRRLHQKIGFDLIHDFTFAKHSEPGFLSLLPLPLVWSSIGSGEFAPAAFWQDFSFQAKAAEIVRSTLRWVRKQNPFVRFNTKKKTVLVQAIIKDRAKHHKIGASQVQVNSKLGLLEEEIALLAKYEIPTESTIRFISIGKLSPWKGFHIGLRAFAQANLPNTEYWIVGEGAELERLQNLAQDLQIIHQVKFWGELPQEKVLDLLSDCHVLVHPSLHDSGEWACIEAMAAGRPVLCLNLGEPAIQVTDKTGIKIAADEPYQAVRDLAAAMIQLAKDREMIVSMGLAGRARVSQHYTWKAVGKNLNQLYIDIVQQANP